MRRTIFFSQTELIWNLVGEGSVEAGISDKSYMAQMDSSSPRDGIVFSKSRQKSIKWSILENTLFFKTMHFISTKFPKFIARS